MKKLNDNMIHTLNFHAFTLVIWLTYLVFDFLSMIAIYLCMTHDCVSVKNGLYVIVWLNVFASLIITLWLRYREFRIIHKKTTTCACCKTSYDEAYHYCPVCGFKAPTEQMTETEMEKNLINSDIRTYKQSQSVVLEPEIDLTADDADPDMNLIQAQQVIDNFINTAQDEDFSEQFEDSD